MFKTAVDIMLFKGFRQEDPEVVQKKVEILALEAEQLKAQTKTPSSEEQVRKQKDSARETAELENLIPSASEARDRTLSQIRKNAEAAIKKEATEILKKSLEAIEFAISDEKFVAEIGGPGRPDPGPIVLRQAYANYHEDARKVALQRLTENGYKAEEIDKIFIRISW